MVNRLVIAWCCAALVLGAQTRDLKLELSKPAPARPGKRWAVIIGVSAYKNAPPHAQLRYAHRDAEELARFFRSDAGGAIPSNQMRVLTDGQATVAAIRSTLHDWLPAASSPTDVVLFYFAGHGVVDSTGSYFVAHDSDPQNLHATGLSFAEVDDTLNRRVKAASVVLLADACHAGSIGWTAPTNSTPAHTAEALERIGDPDRSILKLLASRASERSFEHQRWDGGHGIFTFALLSGLRGEAEQQRDGVIRASELIEYVSRLVPMETEKAQNPRVAGNFDPTMEFARTGQARPQSQTSLAIEVSGPPGASVYLDRTFQGRVRKLGDLRIETSPGEHRLEVELPDGGSFEQPVTLRADSQRLDLTVLPSFGVARLESMVRAGRIIQPGGAWDFFQSQRFGPEQPLATSIIASALENIGQECVNDYVQSSTAGLKGRMLQESAEAYRRLQTLRPNDGALAMKRTFCEARADIAAGRFEEAIPKLEASLRADGKFACAFNALGVALSRLNRNEDAHKAFQRAWELAPEWFLPPLQVAQQFIAQGRIDRALPLLEKAVTLNPRSPVVHWTHLRVLRVSKREPDFLKRAEELTRLFPNYAPTYLEVAAFHESRADFAKALAAYDAYLTLAPNFEDSLAIRSRAEKLRQVAGRKAPTLYRAK